VFSKKLILVALGKEPADLAIINGNLVNVVTKEIYEGGVAVANGKIAAIGDVKYTIGSRTKVIDAKGAYITPGLIDGHIHVETSLMTYSRFAEAVLPHGTTAVMCDFHEVGVVAGIEGIKAMVEEARKTPLKLYLTVPVRIPFHPGLETVGGEIGPREVEELLKLPEAVGLSEIVAMNVLLGDPNYLKALELGKAFKVTLEGHAPALKDQMLSAYAALGIRSDHESFTTEEALQRIRNGMRLMMREGSVAKNLHETVKVIVEKKVDPRYAIMITDDVDAHDILRDGHLDHLIRRAVEEGVDPITALQMVTINTAENYRVDHEVGVLAPGRYADILLVDDLAKFNVKIVIANGEIIARNGKIIRKIAPIIVLGVNLKDMAYAVNRIVELQGGQVVVENGEVITELPLPIAGLMSDEPPSSIAEKVEKLKKAAQKLGSTIYHPFMFLVFITLAAIPQYAITDKGLVDVMKQKLISPIIEYI